jgi:peptidoglycan/LPS O-acetylase OafA/YrhL
VAADTPIAELDLLRSVAVAGVVAFHLFRLPPAASAIAVAIQAIALVGCRSAPLLFMISVFVSVQSAATKDAFSFAKARAINTYCEEVSARLNQPVRASCVRALRI